MNIIDGAIVLAFIVATFAVVIDWLGDWSEQ